MNVITPRTAAFEWVLYHFTGILGASALTLLIFMARDSLQPGIGVVTDGGQFAAYSLATGSTTYYLIHRSSSERLKWSSPIGIANFFVILGAVGLWLVALLYAAGDDYDIRYVEWPSVGLLAYSATVAFLAVWKDQERSKELNKVAALMNPRIEGVEAMKAELAKKTEEAE